MFCFMVYLFALLSCSIVGASPDTKIFPSSEEAIIFDPPYNAQFHALKPMIPNYNKLVAPLTNHSRLIFVVVRIKMREVVDVDTVQEILAVDAELELSWIDWKLREYYISTPDAPRDDLIRYDSDILAKIWKPDIYIDELLGFVRQNLVTKSIRVFIQTRGTLAGTVTFRARQAIKLHCNMDFHYYPADTQKCTFTVRSLSYPTSSLRILWAADKSVFLDAMQNSNFDFQISDVEPGEEIAELVVHYQVTPEITANYSALSFTLEIRRNLMFHMIQTYLPSVLLVLITWLCFLLPTYMVEARVGVSMTTLLTLTAMFTAVRDQSPEVSYIKAIDVWMVFCMFLIFLALVLFTAIHWSLRRLKKVNEFHKTGKHFKRRNGISTIVTRCCTIYAFPLFVIIFISFVTVYATSLMWFSGYYDWHPSSKYNAVVNASVMGSNKMYSRLENRFDGIYNESSYPINNNKHNEALIQALAMEKAAKGEKTPVTIPPNVLINLAVGL